jgi:hypothetical protein
MNEPQLKSASRLIGGFADWRFERYLTMQLLPLFYVLLVLGLSLCILVLVAGLYFLSPVAGVAATLVAPFVWLVAMAVIRTALEYLAMAHRIMRIIEGMDALPGQVEEVTLRVDGITAHVDTLIRHVDDIHGVLMVVRPLLPASALVSRLFRRTRRNAS